MRYIIIINEINAIRESEQISFNSLLSENHINLISKGFEKHELGKKSKLIIIGTMNKGVVGINKLQEAFEQFKEWLTEIYNNIVGSDIDVELNEKMTNLYDSMLEETVEETVEETTLEEE